MSALEEKMNKLVGEIDRELDTLLKSASQFYAGEELFTEIDGDGVVKVTQRYTLGASGIVHNTQIIAPGYSPSKPKSVFTDVSYSDFIKRISFEDKSKVVKKLKKWGY